MTQRFRLFKNGNSNGKRDDNPVGGRISPNHTHGFNVSIPMLNPKSSSQLTYGKSTPIYISLYKSFNRRGNAMDFRTVLRVLKTGRSSEAPPLSRPQRRRLGRQAPPGWKNCGSTSRLWKNHQFIHIKKCIQTYYVILYVYNSDQIIDMFETTHQPLFIISKILNTRNAK